MYNLLIVDDETMLVNSLYEYISRNHSAEYECLKAYSAKQALEVASHIRIDIAVLDIEMPGINGLELHEQLKGIYPHCHVIFLTAYDRFDYAYAAAQQQQTRFLLKTEGYASVLAMIREESDALDQELIHSFLPSDQEVNAVLSYGKNDFLRLILNDQVDADFIEHEASRFHLAMRMDKGVMPVLLRVAPEGRSYSDEKKELIRIASFFRKWFEKRYTLLFLQLSRQYMLYLMQPLENEPVRIELKQELELFLSKATQISERQLSLALADDWTTWASLAQKLRLMRDKLENAPENDGEYICQLDSNTLSMARLVQLGDDLVQQIQKCDEAKIRETLREGMQLAEEVHINFREFTFRQFEKVHLKRTWNEWEYGCKQMAQFAGQMERAQTNEELVAIAIEFARGISQKRTLQTSEELKYAVREADAFIKAHYAEDISLTDIARHVCLSSSYLSRIYKRETGMSTVEKMKEVRIKEAVKLLEATNMKIRDIASAVGYSSSRYFLSVFRSIVGVGPTEYREGKR